MIVLLEWFALKICERMLRLIDRLEGRPTVTPGTAQSYGEASHAFQVHRHAHRGEREHCLRCN